jgi:hypothetical protein
MGMIRGILMGKQAKTQVMDCFKGTSNRKPPFFPIKQKAFLYLLADTNSRTYFWDDFGMIKLYKYVSLFSDLSGKHKTSKDNPD